MKKKGASYFERHLSPQDPLKKCFFSPKNNKKRYSKPFLGNLFRPKSYKLLLLYLFIRLLHYFDF